MKRLFFIFLILVVIGVVGLYTFIEFSVPEIAFVTDTKQDTSRGNEMVLHRLYTSGIDVDAFYNSVESFLISTEFTEDEIYAAALASGTPEFFPAFYFNLYYPDPKTQTFNFNGVIRQEYTENQKNVNFDISNIHLELISEGLNIENVETVLSDSSIKSLNAPVISEDKRSMAINLDNVSIYSFNLTGTGGKVTFQFTYDIVTNSIFPNNVLQSQLLIVYANIFISSDGALSVEYINEPYSAVEDLE